jgi:hypothetical protein
MAIASGLHWTKRRRTGKTGYLSMRLQADSEEVAEVGWTDPEVARKVQRWEEVAERQERE